jgi:putative transposase
VGEERIAAELLLKLTVGVSVSPRTVRRYMQLPVPTRPRSSSQTWRRLIRNHARGTLACDFFVAVTVTFRLVSVFLVMEAPARRPAALSLEEVHAQTAVGTSGFVNAGVAHLRA